MSNCFGASCGNCPLDDLIRRQDAVKAYCENECGKGMTREKCGAVVCGSLFDDIPSAQQWIPCSERLPEELLCDDGYVEPSDPVLICFSNGAVLISRYWGNRRSKIDRSVDYLNWIDQPSWRQDPTAWMPLPEAYKESEDEE